MQNFHRPKVDKEAVDHHGEYRDLHKQYPCCHIQLKRDCSLDAKIADICIGTSAAPSYFPPYYFENLCPDGEKRCFNLIDGGIAAVNPTVVALNEVTKEIVLGSESPEMEALGSQQYLVLSLGSGKGKKDNSYDAKEASNWGIGCWLLNGFNSPIYDVYNAAGSDMVDILMSTFYCGSKNQNGYLRIQDDTLATEVSSMDNSSPTNLNKLVQIGKSLLSKPVSRVNVKTGKYEPVPDEGTNQAALVEFAERLSMQKKIKKITTLN